MDKLVPPKQGCDMIAAAGHDVCFLDTDCRLLAEVATLEDIITLHRCGVIYDTEFECLKLFA